MPYRYFSRDTVSLIGQSNIAGFYISRTHHVIEQLKKLVADKKFRLSNNFCESVSGSTPLVLSQGFGAGAGIFGWSRSRHFGPAPAPP